MIFVGKDDGDDETKKRKKRRKKKKKKRGEEHMREFEKFSSGSDGSENLEDVEYDSHDLLDHEDDDLLFRSDHEFSCESDVPDDQVQPVKLARTAKKKRGRKPKVEEAAVTSEDEDDDFACKACGKVKLQVFFVAIFSLFQFHEKNSSNSSEIPNLDFFILVAIFDPFNFTRKIPHCYAISILEKLASLEIFQESLFISKNSLSE